VKLVWLNPIATVSPATTLNEFAVVLVLTSAFSVVTVMFAVIAVATPFLYMVMVIVFEAAAEVIVPLRYKAVKVQAAGMGTA
jgi:hypothetical protein